MTDTKTAKIDPTKTKLSKEYKHNRPLTACHWEPTSRFIFFGAEDNLVHRYELASGKAISLAAHDSWVRGFGSSPDGKFLYSGGYDGRLGFWPVADEMTKPTRMIDAHDGWVRAVAVSPNGKHIATCGNDLLVKVWNAADGKLIKSFAGHKSHVYNVTFSADGSSLVSCDLKGVVNAWKLDEEKPKELATVQQLHGYDTTFRADIGGARGIAVRGDGGQVALSGISKVTNAFAGVGEIVVALVDVAKEKLDRVLQSKDKTGGTAWGVAHHPDNFWIGLSGGRGGGWLLFWKGDHKVDEPAEKDSKTPEQNEFFKLKLKNDGRGMSLSPDNKQLVVAHADMHLRTYSLTGA